MRVKDIAAVLRRIMGIVLVMCLLSFQSIGSQGIARAESFEEYQLLVGDILLIPTQALSRLSITDPDIADISDAQPDEVTLMGQSPGQTILFLWEAAGKRSIIVRVIPEDLTVLRTRIESLLENAGISTVQVGENSAEGKIVLTGQIPEDKADLFATIGDAFSEQTIDMTTEEQSKDLVQVDAQITELKTTLSKTMGIDWYSGGGAAKTSLNLSLEEKPPYPLDGSQEDFNLGDPFKIGHFFRTSQILAKVDALIESGMATILSKPRIVVKSGREATFIVGGEIPIKTTTSTGGTLATISENVEYKSYGVSLAITPTIKEGQVEMDLSIEISDIDGSNSRSILGEVAFLTRSAQTQLLLDDRQTIVLAGMIRKDRTHYTRKIPFLGSVPVLGLLFGSSGSVLPETDTEVVISLTPTILPTSTVKARALKADESRISIPRSIEPPTEEAVPALTDVVLRDTSGIPPVTKNAGMVTANVPQAVAPYVQMIQEKISSAIAFPYEAQQNGWQGTVKLVLVLKKDGSLRDAFVKESSGYEVFDQDAVNTAQILAPYASFPDSIKEEELSLTIPIVYSQDSFLKNVANRN